MNSSNTSHALELPQENESELSTIRELEIQLQQQNQTIYSLTSQLAEKEKTLKELRNLYARHNQRLQELESQLLHIQSSHGWKILRFYYDICTRVLYGLRYCRDFFGRMWRFVARQSVSLFRHRFFHKANIKIFFLYCRKYGFRHTVQSAIRKLRINPIISYSAINPLILPSLTTSCNENILPLINKKVSIVIPTRNAGHDFALLLRKLKSQEGLRESEIIIVDSGSTDETLKIAAKSGANVLQIPPETFTHAYSRNQGAEIATGDYILFMVQDALPLSNSWLWEMAMTLEQNGVVAVSCAEYPRSDCDLFYRFLSWNHYRTMNLDKDRFLAWDESCGSHFGLRSNGQISDIAALIRRDIFEKYRFKTRYAEDLDLGIRLIKNRHRIGFLYSTRVLHSHNRPAYYFLKRSYVDSKYLKELFDDFEYPVIDDPQRLFQDIVSMYFRTKQVAVHLTRFKPKQREKISNLVDRIKEMYYSDLDGIEELESKAPDEELEAFVLSLTAFLREQPIVYRYKENMLLPIFLHQLQMLQTYISQSTEFAGELLMRDLGLALYKLTALHSGAYIAYLYLTLSQRELMALFPTELDKKLVSGV